MEEVDYKNDVFLAGYSAFVRNVDALLANQLPAPSMSNEHAIDVPCAIATSLPLAFPQSAGCQTSTRILKASCASCLPRSSVEIILGHVQHRRGRDGGFYHTGLAAGRKTRDLESRALGHQDAQQQEIDGKATGQCSQRFKGCAKTRKHKSRGGRPLRLSRSAGTLGCVFRIGLGVTFASTRLTTV